MMSGRPAWLDPRTLLRTIPFFLPILITAALSYRYHTLLRDQRDLVDHTYQVIGALQAGLVRMIDAETGSAVMF